MHLREALRYVALNPVRAKCCTDPADWPWSAHAALAGLTAAPDFLAVKETHEILVPNGGTSDYLSFIAAADRVDPQTTVALTRAAALPDREIAPVTFGSLVPPLPAGPSVEDLTRAHREEGRTLAEIGRELGCHRSTVLRRIRSLDAQQNGR